MLASLCNAVIMFRFSAALLPANCCPFLAGRSPLSIAQPTAPVQQSARFGRFVCWLLPVSSQTNLALSPGTLVATCTPVSQSPAVRGTPGRWVFAAQRLHHRLELKLRAELPLFAGHF